jgi:Condensation domain
MDLAAGQTAEPVLERRKPGDPRLISFTQRRLWYLEQLIPGTGAYNVPYVMRMKGSLNPEALRQAINTLVGRHEGLRTVFLAPGGNPVPVVLSKWQLDFKQFDLRQASEPEAEAKRIVSVESSRPFNLARDPLLRAAVIRMAEEEWVFVHTSHHIAFDGSSVPIMYKEVSLLYRGFLTGHPAELPEPPIQYSDFALWQTRYLQGERLAQLSAYWKQQLAGAPALRLPADRPRPATSTGKGTRYPVAPRMEDLQQIKDLSKASGTTPFRGACAAFVVLLHCYSGQEDISIGSPVAPPLRPGMDGAIGFFVNTLVLRIDLSGDPTFRELMLRVHRVVQQAIEHADLTLDKLVEAVRPPREASRMPLFQVNFRFLKGPMPALQLNHVSSTYPRAVDTGTAKFDLSVEIEAGTGEGGFFEYSTELFNESTIAQIAQDYETVLRALMAEPDSPLKSLPAVQQLRQRIAEHKTGYWS